MLVRYALDRSFDHNAGKEQTDYAKKSGFVFSAIER